MGQPDILVSLDRAHYIKNKIGISLPYLVSKMSLKICKKSKSKDFNLFILCDLSIWELNTNESYFGLCQPWFELSWKIHYKSFVKWFSCWRLIQNACPFLNGLSQLKRDNLFESVFKYFAIKNCLLFFIMVVLLMSLKAIIF